MWPTFVLDNSENTFNIYPLTFSWPSMGHISTSILELSSMYTMIITVSTSKLFFPVNPLLEWLTTNVTTFKLIGTNKIDLLLNRQLIYDCIIANITTLNCNGQVLKQGGQTYLDGAFCWPTSSNSKIHHGLYYVKYVYLIGLKF